MQFSILIPQLFYDLIGRVIPGATLIILGFLLFDGPQKAKEYLIWSDKTLYVVIGDLLAAHIIGSLIGGLWFQIYRVSPLKCSNFPCEHPRCNRLLKLNRRLYRLIGAGWLDGWAKNGEQLIDEAFAKVFGVKKENWPKVRVIRMGEISCMGRISLMYDYLHLCSPRAATRIAKLRAEQHMSAVLMIGFFMLAIVYLFSFWMWGSIWELLGVESELFLGILATWRLTWHLEKRSDSALFYSWFLVHFKIVKEDQAIERAKAD